MSLGNWKGLDGARALRLSEASSKGAEWSSSDECFSRVVLEETSPSSCSDMGAYWEELDFALEENMARWSRRRAK